ncbi:MAG: class I SAM-dependent methyltransferase [Nanoarchaeota archaeon]
MKRNFSGKDIADLFDEVIDWEKRKAGEGDFFLKLLKDHQCRTVFDSAAGVGYDSVRLALAGFDVTSNEIDPYLQDTADRHANEHGLRLTWTEGYTWDQLQHSRSLYHRNGGYFDAVLCTGNSLALELDPDDQRESLLGLHAILKKGGLLIVDSRNYERILWEKEKILEEPKANFPFSYKYYYTNPDVSDIPVEIHQDRIVFEAANKRGMSARFELYPFKMLELKYLLMAYGFHDVQIYEDFKPIKEYSGSDCDFFQYIAVKK